MEDDMSRKVFFDTIRNSMYGGKLSQRQVVGINAILDAWKAEPYTDLRWLALILGQSWLEVGKNMYPVREGAATSDATARAL